MKIENYPNWLVPIEIAKKLKEIGFDKKCYFTVLPRGLCGAATFDADYLGLQDANFKVSSMYGGYNLPFWTDVFEWFNQNGLFGVVEYEGNEIYVIKIIIKGSHSVRTDNKKYNSYYSCKCALINNLIELYKNENSIEKS